MLAFNTHGATRGRKEDIARLVSALTSSFGDQRFLLYLRRPLPEDVDPAPVARAVHLWLLAIERGEWLGRHAVYDDDGVSIELSLLPGAPGMAAMVGPTNALEQLALVDHHVLEAMELMDNNVPTVLSVCSATGWNLPRGFTEQLLYGTADQVVSGDEYRATFRETAMALFSDAGATDLASLWWLETPGDDMSVRGWATDNPWVRHDIPVFPGHRFSVARRVADRAELTWHSSEPTVWGRR